MIVLRRVRQRAVGVIDHAADPPLRPRCLASKHACRHGLDVMVRAPAVISPKHSGRQHALVGHRLVEEWLDAALPASQPVVWLCRYCWLTPVERCCSRCGPASPKAICFACPGRATMAITSPPAAGQDRDARKIPVGAPLKEALDAATKRCPVILTNTDGKPWTSDGFRSSWRKACSAAGVVGVADWHHAGADGFGRGRLGGLLQLFHARQGLLPCQLPSLRLE